MEPPVLSHYSDAPVYEVTTMVQLLKVRPLALWTWEQHLGLSSGDPANDPNRQKRRYSERDLVALLWLRDRVIAGETPQDATARLLGAQRGMRGQGYGVSGALASEPLGMEPFNQGPSGLLAGGPPFAGQASGALNSGALHTPQSYDPSQQGGPDEVWPAPPTGSLGAATFPGRSGVSRRPAQPGYGAAPDPWGSDPRSMGGRGMPTDTRPGGYFDSQRLDGGPSASAPQAGGASGRLGGIYGAPLEPPAYPLRGRSMSQSLSSIRELRPAIPQLLQSFARFDTARANAVITEALRNYGVENVCVGLIQPTVLRISELWSKCELSNPEERFGLNHLRLFMSAVYHSTQEPMGAPFVVVGCAPNETSDFGALLLAVLWRRAGLRVIYLGRGIDADQLLQQSWPVTPAIIALTATTSQRLRALARIGKKLSEQPQPQPIFAYWGPVFVRNPDLRRKLTGVYLGDDAAMATRHVRQLLNLDGFAE